MIFPKETYESLMKKDILFPTLTMTVADANGIRTEPTEMGKYVMTSLISRVFPTLKVKRRLPY